MARDVGLWFCGRTKVLGHQADDCLCGCHRCAPLLPGIGFKGQGRWGQGIRVARRNIVLIQHASGGDVDCESRIDLGAAFGQLRHGVDGNRAVPMADEKGFEGLLGCLLSHKTGVREIATPLVALGDGQIVLSLA